MRDNSFFDVFPFIAFGAPETWLTNEDPEGQEKLYSPDFNYIFSLEKALNIQEK